MNYNDYDSNGNEKNFDLSLLFTDKKYRSRLILGIYFVFFVILITFVRTGIKADNSLNDNNNEIVDNEVINNEDNNDDSDIIVNEDSDENDDEFNEEFSNIMSNNYNFEFTLVSDSNVFVASGKRYNEKYDFKLTDGESVINYLSDGIRVNAENDGEYYDTNLPFYYINYFDNDILYDIVSSSVEVGDNSYAISNKALLEFVDSLYKREISDNDSINSIKLKKEDDIIVSIELDITNIVNSLGISDTNKTIITLKYSNFNHINDFEINF